MEQELFIQYIEMINRYEAVSESGNSIHPTNKEADIMRKIKDITNSNPKYMNLLKKIHSLPPTERVQALNNLFPKNQQEHGDEELIAKTFGVKVDQIRHYYLSNGKELFSFYSDKLQREVVLENGKKGKSITEYLKDIQNENEKYQTKDDSINTNSILMDERIKKNIELDFLSKEELLSQEGVVDNLSEEDKRKLKYLINNYDQLNIRGIDIVNMTFIDDGNSVHEVIIDSNQKVAVAEPTELNAKDVSKVEEEPVLIETQDYDETEIPEEVPSKEDNEIDEMIEDEDEEVSEFDDLPANIRAQIVFYYNNPDELEKIEDQQEKDKWKHYISVYSQELEKKKNAPKIMIKNNINGFVDSALYISVAVGAVLIVALLISLFYYYVL